MCHSSTTGRRAEVVIESASSPSAPASSLCCRQLSQHVRRHECDALIRDMEALRVGGAVETDLHAVRNLATLIEDCAPYVAALADLDSRQHDGVLDHRVLIDADIGEQKRSAHG